MMAFLAGVVVGILATALTLALWILYVATQDPPPGAP